MPWVVKDQSNSVLKKKLRLDAVTMLRMRRVLSCYYSQEYAMKTCCCVLWRMPHLRNYLLSRLSKQKPKFYQVCLLKRDQQGPINMHYHINF